MYQKLSLIGNLGTDPEMRFTAQGQAVTNFSMAVNEGKDKTAWFRISVWGDQAEPCKTYLSKGRQVYVEGRLQYDENGNPRTFQRKDGSTGVSFEVNAGMVKFLGGRGDAVETDNEQVPF